MLTNTARKTLDRVDVVPKRKHVEMRYILFDSGCATLRIRCKYSSPHPSSANTTEQRNTINMTPAVSLSGTRHVNE
jgi:hypothetical protein